MIAVGVAAAIGFATGLITALAIHRWWRIDTAAPRMRVETAQRQVARHPVLTTWLRARTDPTVITGALLTLAVVVIAIGVAAFGIVLTMVRTNRGFANFDVSAARWGAGHATNASTDVLRGLTTLGSFVVLVPVALLVAVVEGRRQRRLPAVLGFLVIDVGGQYALANVIKAVVDRARPDISPLAAFSGPSFPSGHSTAAAAVLAAFAMLMGRGRSRRVKAVLAGVAVGMAAAIASSRVLLGVHWLTDVLAGLSLGWAWFALSSIAFGGRLLRFGAPVEAVAVAAADPLSPPADPTQ